MQHESLRAPFAATVGPPVERQAGPLTGREHRGLAQHHEVVCLRVTDPREHDLPAAGLVWVEDAETGEQLFVDTDDPGFRARLAAAADAQTAALRLAVTRTGAELHDVTTEDDLVHVLGRIAALRESRRGRSATMGGPR